ncbi:MAG: hypothetical protein ACOYLN_11175 [Blastocatellia bacterium]|jgi:hypothetical protein
MYQRPHFLEELHAIREEMARECDYDVDLFAEMVRSNQAPKHGPAHNIRGVRKYAPPQETPQEPREEKPRRKRKPGASNA